MRDYEFVAASLPCSRLLMRWKRHKENSKSSSVHRHAATSFTHSMEVIYAIDYSLIRISSLISWLVRILSIYSFMRKYIHFLAQQRPQKHEINENNLYNLLYIFSSVFASVCVFECATVADEVLCESIYSSPHMPLICIDTKCEFV